MSAISGALQGPLHYRDKVPAISLVPFPTTAATPARSTLQLGRKSPDALGVDAAKGWEVGLGCKRSAQSCLRSLEAAA